VPTYEYQCTSCGREFEVRQRISEPALTRCEQCGGAVKRLLSPAPFILKGGGWYVTDYPLESEKSGSASKDSTTTEKAAPEKSEKAAAPTSGSASTSAPGPTPAKSSTD
jgi:putative FmdB family regulatory protein